MRGHRPNQPEFKGNWGCKPHLRVPASTAHPRSPLNIGLKPVLHPVLNSIYFDYVRGRKSPPRREPHAETAIAAAPGLAYGRMRHHTAPTDPRPRAGQGGAPARPSPGALRRHASVLRAAHGAPRGAKYTIYRHLRVRSSQYRISKGSEGAVRAHGHPQTQRTGHNLRKIGVAA